MYRVNKAGQFNVPIGSKQDCIYDIDSFPAYSKLLSSAVLEIGDFATIIENAGDNDLVFADPPYTISHNQNSFIKYNEQLFTWNDQERLLESVCAARDKGAKIIVTNANFEPLKEKYLKKGFNVKVLERHNVMSSKVEKRKKQEELLITSFTVDNINDEEVSRDNAHCID